MLKHCCHSSLLDIRYTTKCHPNEGLHWEEAHQPQGEWQPPAQLRLRNKYNLDATKITQGIRRQERPSLRSRQRRTRIGNQRRQQSASRAAHWAFLEGEAFRYDPANNYDSHPQLYIGQMTHVCSNCHALKWPGEAPGMCCSGGKVRLPALRPPPEPLESLMSGTTS